MQGRCGRRPLEGAGHRDRVMIIFFSKPRTFLRFILFFCVTFKKLREFFPPSKYTKVGGGVPRHPLIRRGVLGPPLSCPSSRTLIGTLGQGRGNPFVIDAHKFCGLIFMGGSAKQEYFPSNYILCVDAAQEKHLMLISIVQFFSCASMRMLQFYCYPQHQKTIKIC